MMQPTIARRSRWLERIRPAACSLPLLAFLYAVGPSSAQTAAVRSEAGHFTIRVTGIDRPERLNHLHGFDLWLATADGQPATGARIMVTGQRHYSSTPLPTLPQVTAAPDAGHYRVGGLRFHMPGEWRLAFDIIFKQILDRATLDVVVK